MGTRKITGMNVVTGGLTGSFLMINWNGINNALTILNSLILSGYAWWWVVKTFL